MVYNKTKWIAQVKKAVADLGKNAKPSAGLPTAIATIRFIRDGLCDDIGEADDEAKAICTTVKDCCNELLKQLSSKGVEDGFASNASAAAKAAGFKSTSESLVELSE